jgi:hypothetical protein
VHGRDLFPAGGLMHWVLSPVCQSGGLKASAGHSGVCTVQQTFGFMAATVCLGLVMVIGPVGKVVLRTGHAAVTL